MVDNFFKKGAEAELKQVLIEGQAYLSKKRIKKSYRDEKLDLDIRKKRTRSEAKILSEASQTINVPKILKVDDKTAEIIMEYIPGKPLKEVLAKNEALCFEAGEKIRALHELGIIHGDLTTSNILFVDKEKANKEMKDRIEKKGNLFFVDFGLGFFSKKIEDKATDLVVFKKTFNATHSSIKGGWEKVMKGYNPTEELTLRMSAIEKRARYH
jgi:Kae1-associated kinase Bud32